MNEKHIIGFLFAVCICLNLFLGSLLLGLSLLKIPDIRTVAEYQPMQASEIYDRHGGLITRIYQENRTVVPLAELPAYLPKAFVAAEDSRFYIHPGLDFWSVLRAFIANIRSGHRGQGGSTITQQVAKSLLLSPEKTYLRKFKEAILAWRIDTLLSKDDILHIYLNQIYLGGGAHGVEAASRLYFTKSARDLGLGEAALLAGLPQAPSRYAPDRNMKEAKERQRYVLNRMAADGVISALEARKAYDSKIEVSGDRGYSGEEDGYFVQLVRKMAEQVLGQSLNRAGVRIYTTMDPELQSQTTARLISGLQDTFPNNNQVQGAAVIIDGTSGRVRALVGGRDYNKSVFDRATQARRSAGSLFKAILYSAAFEHGLTPENTVVDEPLAIRGKDGKPWQPKNYSGKYYGETSLGDALVYSRNIPAIKVLQKVGIDYVRSKAEEFGIQPPITSDLSLALGATGVSLLEITAAYSPFVNDGKYESPVFINAIRDSGGKLIYRGVHGSREVLSGETVKIMRGLLAEVIDRGTGKGAAGISSPYGGKTGTTNGNRDAWFVGYSQDRLCGVWIGNDNNEGLGPGKTGGGVAAYTWGAIMNSVTR